MTRLALLAGLLSLGLAWAPPLTRLVPESFAAHMVVHMGVVAVAAPLLALGLAPWAARRLGGLGLGLPAAATLFDLVIIWAWHAPALHHAAREGGMVFVAEQVSFLVAGLGVWLSALASGAEGRGGALAGAAALFFTSMHMTLLGVLLGLARVPVTGEPAAAALADQHLGGVIMLALGGAVYLLGGLGLVARELRSRSRPAGGAT